MKHTQNEYDELWELRKEIEQKMSDLFYQHKSEKKSINRTSTIIWAISSLSILAIGVTSIVLSFNYVSALLQSFLILICEILIYFVVDWKTSNYLKENDEDYNKKRNELDAEHSKVEKRMSEIIFPSNSFVWIFF